MTDYDEALLVITNPDSMLLPERRHLIALYKHIYELQQELKEMNTELVSGKREGIEKIPEYNAPDFGDMTL